MECNEFYRNKMLIIFDEVDYIGSSQITNALNIRNEAPERIKVIAASTPCGKHEEYYKWCTESSKSYKPLADDIKNYKFTGYNVTKSIDERNKKGNGWVEIYAPSVVNKELLKINPDTGQTYLEDLKDEFSEMRYAQEVMAEFGEEELGVYQRKYLIAAIKEGVMSQHHYFNNMTAAEIKQYRLHHRRNKFIMGVDWDFVQAGTTIVVLMLDADYVNENGDPEPKFKVILREEIKKAHFTFTEAVDRIIQLNDIYDLDWIAVDRGYGDTQIELLHKYGIENPRTGLAEKVVGYQFGEKIEVRDPFTFKKASKHMKPFMVNNSVVAFEKGKIIFDPSDETLIKQFEDYKVLRVSTTGLPIYTDENEHIVDAVNLALLIFQQKYGKLFRNIISTRILQVNIPDIASKEPIDDRLENMMPAEIKSKLSDGMLISTFKSVSRSPVSKSFTTETKMFGTNIRHRDRGFNFRRRSF